MALVVGIKELNTCPCWSKSSHFVTMNKMTPVFMRSKLLAYFVRSSRYDKWVVTQNIKAELRIMETLNLCHYFNLEINQNSPWER